MFPAKLIKEIYKLFKTFEWESRATLSRLSLPKTIGGVSISNIRYYNWTSASCLQIATQ